MENLNFQWTNQQQCPNIQNSLDSSADYNVIAGILDPPDGMMLNSNSTNSSKVLITQNHEEGICSYNSTFQPSSVLQSANLRCDSGDDFFNPNGFLQREDGLTSVFSDSESMQNLNSGDSNDCFSCISSKDKDYIRNSHLCHSDGVLQSNTTEVSPDIKFRQGIESFDKIKQMIYHAAVLRPVNLGPEKPSEKRKRKNVRISSDPQTVAARQRRVKIGEKLSVLQTLVPGGSKLDTASMLDEACNYLRFLKSQVSLMEHRSGRRVYSRTSSSSDVHLFFLPPPFDKSFHFHKPPLSKS